MLLTGFEVCAQVTRAGSALWCIGSGGLTPPPVQAGKGERHGGAPVSLQRQRPLQLVGQGTDQLEA
jgi:hypothetical protein